MSKDIGNNVEWRAVPGLPNYEASSDGRVRIVQRELRQYRTAGYPAVYVREAGRAIHVHRLVALAFHGPAPDDRAVVRHINDAANDNRAENLAWGSRRENWDDAVRNGRTANHSAWRKQRRG